MLKSEGDRLTRVVVCSPREEYFSVADLEGHNFIQAPDRDLAIRQHDGLKSILRDFGAEVMDIPELARHPNSVFTRDTALCTPFGSIRLRLGLDTRRGEGRWMSDALESIGEACAGEIKVPGTVEGGDVILVGSVAFVGRSVRTNDEGVAQLSSLLRGMGYEVRTISLAESILHLDKVLMAAGPTRMLSCTSYIPKESLKGFEVIDVSCRGCSSANIICLGDNQVIVDRSNRTVVAGLEEHGFSVHAIDLSEFAKATGGPNCLIMPVERV
jgi:dimethylargininase